MRTVITISLNGNAYQLDAVGYDALRAYLQVAEQRLAGNPDQAEILADLEQAIADKCHRYLGPHKNVVSADEVTEVIREMGPVDGGAGEAAAQAGAGPVLAVAQKPTPPKNTPRLLVRPGTRTVVPAAQRAPHPTRAPVPVSLAPQRRQAPLPPPERHLAASIRSAKAPSSAACVRVSRPT